MTARPEFASLAEAATAVRGGLGYLAAIDPAQLPAGEQAELLRLLEQAHALETAARARGLAAFTAGQGYHEDGCYGARSWLIHHLGVTKGAAGGLPGLGPAGRHPPPGPRRPGRGGHLGVGRPDHLRLDRPAPGGLPGRG